MDKNWTIMANGRCPDDPMDDPGQRVWPRLDSGTSEFEWLPTDGRVTTHDGKGLTIGRGINLYPAEYELDEKIQLHITDSRVILAAHGLAKLSGALSGFADRAARTNQESGLAERTKWRNQYSLVVQIDYTCLQFVRYSPGNWRSCATLDLGSLVGVPGSGGLQTFQAFLRGQEVAAFAEDIRSRASRVQLANEFGLLDPDKLEEMSRANFVSTKGGSKTHFPTCIHSSTLREYTAVRPE